MVRIALLALVVAVGGGAPSLGGFLEMVTSAGAIWDPFGHEGLNSSAPTGGDTEDDAGNIWDPFG
jgi:hypothetical protein